MVFNKSRDVNLFFQNFRKVQNCLKVNWPFFYGQILPSSILILKFLTLLNPWLKKLYQKISPQKFLPNLLLTLSPRYLSFCLRLIFPSLFFFVFTARHVFWSCWSRVREKLWANPLYFSSFYFSILRSLFHKVYMMEKT